MGKRWLWECKDVQKDLIVLQERYKELGYNLTKEQAYDAWYMYCESCSANWMTIDKDVIKSKWAIEKVLNPSENN